MHNKYFNTLPRAMENDCINIPFSACFVIKKISNFNSLKASINVYFTLILRMKFTGIDKMEQVMKYFEEN